MHSVNKRSQNKIVKLIMLASTNKPNQTPIKSILKRTIANNTPPNTNIQPTKQTKPIQFLGSFSKNTTQKYTEASLTQTKQQYIPLAMPELSKNLSTPQIRLSDIGKFQLNKNKPNSPTNSEPKYDINNSKLKTAESLVSFQNSQLLYEQQQYDIRITQPTAPPTPVSIPTPIPKSNFTLHHQISLPSIQERQRIQSSHLQVHHEKMHETPHKLKSKPSKAINDTKMKLRDYLFMANTSTTVAASKKRNAVQQKSQILVVKPQTERIQGETKRMNGQSDINVKYNYQSQKYRISNKQMSAILKKQINRDFLKLREKTGQIQNYLNLTEFVQNEDMVKLYALRREIQDLSSKLTRTFSEIEADSLSVTSIVSDQDDNGFRQI